MNINQMMKQAQQMQERLQKQMADLRVEATAGGGMVTVVMDGLKQLQKITIEPEVVSKDDVEMLQDLIVAAVNDAHRKVDEALPADERADGRHGAARHVLSGHDPPEPLARLIEQLQRLPGIGAKSAQRLAFHVLKTPREDVERLADALREVKDRVTYCSVCNNITDTDPCALCASTDRDHRIICVVEEPQNVAAVERTRGFRGRVSRAARRAVAAAGHRPGRPEDQGAARARGERATWRRSSSPRTPTSKARPPPSTLRACSSRSASRSPASPWASRSAATSNTPTRSPCRRRWKADAPCRSGAARSANAPYPQWAAGGARQGRHGARREPDDRQKSLGRPRRRNVFPW